MGIKLGDVSPLAGMVTGSGKLGELMQQGLGGLIPMQIARNAAESEEEKRRKAMQGGAPMKKGGKVKAKASSASKRADGIAQRGKTRGRFV